MHRSSLLGGNSMLMYRSGYELPVWLGDTTCERDAKTVTLADSQAAQGQHITIPVPKIHQVSGALWIRRQGRR